MTLLLADSPLGAPATLRRCTGDSTLRRHLAELGFVRGATVAVLARGAARSLVVAVGDARVALDAAVCRGVEVELLAAGLSGG